MGRGFESFCPCQKKNEAIASFFFYPSRRLGMESRFSVYVIAKGVWHHRRCISRGLIPCACFASNSIPQASCGFHPQQCCDLAREFKSVGKVLKHLFIVFSQKKNEAIERYSKGRFFKIRHTNIFGKLEFDVLVIT